MPEAEPVPAGGPITDGVYVLTEIRMYPSGSSFPPPPARETQQYSGTTLNRIVEQPAGEVHDRTVEYRFEGTWLRAVASMCGGDGWGTVVQYDASPTQVIWYGGGSSDPLAYVFTRK